MYVIFFYLIIDFHIIKIHTHIEIDGLKQVNVLNVYLPTFL